MPDKDNEIRLTSIQTDSETSRMLGMVASAYERSKAAQLRVLVKREYDTLAGLKLLPTTVIDEQPQDTQVA